MVRTWYCKCGRVDIAATAAAAGAPAAAGTALAPPRAPGLKHMGPSGPDPVSKKPSTSGPAHAPEQPTPSPAPAFVPWRLHAAAHGKPLGPNPGCRVNLICPAIPFPPGYSPRVHGLAAVPKELAARALEASRIVGSFGRLSIESILDESWAALAAWPRERLIIALLDAVCATAGANRLAERRRHLFNLDRFMQAHYAAKAGACMCERVGATVLSEYLVNRLEADEARKALAKARRADGLPTAAADGADSDCSGSAAAALSALESASQAYSLRLNTSHPILNQYRTRPRTREGGGAVAPEPLLAVHLELGAADPSLAPIERALMSMLALVLHVCARKALADRSRCPRRSANGHAIGAAGMDLKKSTWRSAGRPLICSPLGWTGSDAWFNLAVATLDGDAYNERCMSLLRMHNGPGGDVSKATGWLDREPLERELCLIIDHVCALDVHMVDRHQSRSAHAA